ncbi:MAG: DNA-binding protein [Myxococcales bacterium]|nr:MAG: DNA-binding protein [Myxococcales bacterium]
MPSALDAALRDAVETFVVQLRELFQRSALEMVQSALGGGEAPAPRRGGRRTAPTGGAVAGGARKKGAKRSPEELEGLVSNLLAYVKKNPGQRIEQIGAGLGLATKELALPAKKLIADKQLRTKGQKRATTYFSK